MKKINDSMWESAISERRETIRFYALCLFMLFLTVLVIHVNLFVIMNIEVSGSSMETTLQNGDNLIAVRGSEAHRGDVVIIDKNYGTNKTAYLLIKRVIAVGGDNIVLENGDVYLNGELLIEPYLDGVKTYAKNTDKTVRYEYTLKEDEYFYMGDNREHSSDARDNGPCNKNAVVSVVTGWSISAKDFLTGLNGFFGSISSFIDETLRGSK